jgi:AraC family transcriptional regulator
MKAITFQDYEQRMLRVLVHIQQHLDETLLLEDLAGLACFSPFHFHRIFKGMVGETLSEHIRRLRLERAATLLKRGARPVTRIALEAGYGSHEAFTRSFHARFGCSPKDYRAARGNSAPPVVPSGVHYSEHGRPARFRTVLKRGKEMRVTVEEREPLRVAFMRHVGPYSKVGAVWERLLPELGKEGLIGGGSMFIGVCLDDPDVTPAGRIRYDACVSVGADYLPNGEIGVQIIAGGIYARTTHFGPYDQIGRTYSRLLGHWLPRSGVELCPAPCFESYLNDPNSTEPEDLITDIYAPLDRVPRGKVTSIKAASFP